MTATGREAEDLAAALTSLLDEHGWRCFPAWETLPHERLSPAQRHRGPAARRAAPARPPGRRRRGGGPLQRDRRAGPGAAAADRAGAGRPASRYGCEAGDDAELDGVVARLVENGYHRVDMVEKRGEVAVRGGLLDVFPPTEEHPLRLEFWGDTVEEIRWFKVADQRSLEAAEDGLFAPPCRELLLTEEVRERARELAEEHPALAEVLDQLAEGTPVEGMEAFAPVLCGEMELLIDHLPAGGRVRLRPRADQGPGRGAGAHQPGVPGGVLDHRRGGRRGADRPGRGGVPHAGGGPRPRGRARAAVVVDGAVRGEDDRRRRPAIEPATVRPDGARDAEAYRGDTQRALDDIKGWLAEGKAVVLLSEGHGPAERMVELLKGVDVPPGW